MINIDNKKCTSDEYACRSIEGNEKIPDKSKVKEYILNLKKINLRLWDIEEGKRLAEKKYAFTQEENELTPFRKQNNRYHFCTYF